MKLIHTCYFCGNDYEKEGTPDTQPSNEIIVLRAFVREFSPFHSVDIILNKMTYFELCEVVKDIANEM